MPDQGNALGALMPEEPGWTYGELLPLRSRQGAAGPEMELAWPGAVRSVVNGLGALMGGMDAPQGLSDNPDPLQAATGGRLEAQAENPLLAMALRGIGVRGDPNELGIFAGVHGKAGPRAAGDWFTGVDALPRFEISDYPASIKSQGVPTPDSLIYTKSGVVTKRLGDVLDHPELYEQYPELKNMKLQFDANLGPGLHGALYPNQKIVVNPFRWEKKTLGDIEFDTPRRATDEELISTILHESQHQVQTIEGFAGGSNVDSVAQQLHWAKQYLAQKALEAQSPSEFLEYGKQAGQIDKLLEQADPYGLYKDTAGEVEARNVQTRRAWQLKGAEKYPSLKARYNTGETLGEPPGATEDVPQSLQLLLPSRPPEGFDFRPVDHDPFGHIMVPVEHDPFQPQLKPVDHDPFAPMASQEPPARVPAPYIAAEPKDLWKLSPADLTKLLADKTSSDDAKLVQALGEDGAKQFNSLYRASHSQNTEKADAASAKLAEMESAFTPEQHRLVYGIGDSAAQADEISAVLKGHEDLSLDKHGNGPDLDHVAWESTLGLRRVSPAEIIAVPKEGGTPEAQAAYLMLLHGYQEMKKRGVAAEDIPGLLVKGAAKVSGRSQQEIADFIGSFVEEAKRAKVRKLGNE